MRSKEELAEELANDFVIDYLDRDIDFMDVSEFLFDDNGIDYEENEDLFEEVYQLASAMLGDLAQVFEGRND